MAKGLHHLQLADGLVDERRLLATGNGLLLEHGIGALGNEIRHHKGQRRDQHHYQSDLPVDGHHEDQGAEDGHDARKQLGKTHQQAVGQGVHIGNDPAHQLAPGMPI